MFARRTTRWASGLGVVLVWSLVTGPSAFAWAWPADGAVLRGFSVGGDAYAPGQHRGIDVALEGSAAIRAPVAGEVTFAGAIPTNGLTVTIAFHDAKVSLTHVGTLHVRRGDVVSEGDVLAEAGPTGEAEHGVPYVHVGVRVGPAESYVDPLTLLPPRRASLPPSTPEAPPAPQPSPEPSAPTSAVPESPAAMPPAAPAPVSVAAPETEPTAGSPSGSNTSVPNEAGGGIEINSRRMPGTARRVVRSNHVGNVKPRVKVKSTAREREGATSVVVPRPSLGRTAPSPASRDSTAAGPREPRTVASGASAAPVRPGNDHRLTRASGHADTGGTSIGAHWIVLAVLVAALAAALAACASRSPAGRAKGTPYHWRP